ncbi:hypothetical protein K2X83_02690 [Patescibacteria group bacterium]|nr:hypothetical protein [Patescibacteria group bacterium]
MSHRFFLTALAFCVGAFLFLIFGSDLSATRHIVKITDDGFSPAEIYISQGDRVLFVNTTQEESWPASDIHPMHAEYPGSDIRNCVSIKRFLSFDACRGVEPGETYGFTFDEAGEWKFHDHAHSERRGVVRVEPVTDFRPTPLRHAFSFAVGIPDILRTFFDSARSNTGSLIAGKYSYSDLVTSKDYRTESAREATLNELDTLRMVYQIGVSEALRRSASDTEGGSLIRCHTAGHYIGRAGVDLFGVDALRQCDVSCHSGCYHGVMERLGQDENGSQLLKSLIGYCAGLPTEFEQYQCFHGMGHGYMLFSGLDLDQSLRACEETGSESAKFSCYGGVFMENVQQGSGEPGVVGHLPGAEKLLSRSDLQYPCTRFISNVPALQMCYNTLVTWIKKALEDDVSAVIETCLEAPEVGRPWCFRSFGRSFAGGDFQFPDRSEHYCGLVPEPYRDDCITGVSKLAVDFYGIDHSGQSVAFCKGLAKREFKEICYNHFTMRLPELFLRETDRLSLCERFESPFNESCRNAVLEPVLPP